MIQKWLKFHMFALIFLFCSQLAFGQQGTLQIPTTHPRLWLTAERLPAARAWYAAHPFTPAGDEYAGQAFRY